MIRKATATLTMLIEHIEKELDRLRQLSVEDRRYAQGYIGAIEEILEYAYRPRVGATVAGTGPIPTALENMKNRYVEARSAAYREPTSFLAGYACGYESGQFVALVEPEFAALSVDKKRH